jgi:hypothetical protein
MATTQNIFRTLALTVALGTLLGIGTFAVEYYGEGARGTQVENPYYGPAF